MTEQTKAPAPEFRMQKMYIKDLSFENPNAPDIYVAQTEKPPEVEVNLQMNNRQVQPDHYEVTLEITAKISNKDAGKTTCRGLPDLALSFHQTDCQPGLC